MNKNKRPFKIKVLAVFLILLLVALVMFCLEVTNTTHIFHKTAVVRAPTKPITKLASSTTGTSSSTKTQSAGTTINQGGPSDENGQAPTGVPTSPSDWSTSTSGVVTVKLPGASQTFKSGGTLTGTASVDQVQYRLTDNQVGVISQGPISVVNGNFTAAINFKSYGSTGRLDVFTTDATGKESNEVQIPVNF